MFIPNSSNEPNDNISIISKFQQPMDPEMLAERQNYMLDRLNESRRQRKEAIELARQEHASKPFKKFKNPLD